MVVRSEVQNIGKAKAADPKELQEHIDEMGTNQLREYLEAIENTGWSRTLCVQKDNQPCVVPKK